MKKIIAEIDRRNLFRYLGNSAVLLPFMRTLFETEAFGANTSKRAIFFYYPSGMIGEHFHPNTLGSGYELPLTLDPLKALRNDLVVLNNIAFPSGVHGHDAGSAYSLTGKQGGDSVSIDNYIGNRFKAIQRSVYLGIASGKEVGPRSQFSFQSTDSNPGMGQGPAVARTIEDNPRKAFESIFGAAPGFAPGASLAETTNDSRKFTKSVLDYCMEDTKSLKNRLGNFEKQKLDLHMSSLRELERQIQAANAPDPSTPTGMPSVGAACTKTVDFKGLPSPTSEVLQYYQDNANFGKVTDIMIELGVQALACGVTNSLFIQCSRSRSPTNMGAAAGFDVVQHDASHHDSQAANLLLFAKIQTYFMGRYAHLLNRLKSISEGDKTLLYNSISLAFSEVSDPNYHEGSRMGVLLAGQAGGKLKTGFAIDAMANKSGLVTYEGPCDSERRKRLASGMPGGSMVTGVSYNHVLVTILQAMGINEDTYGSAEFGRGPIPGLLNG